MLELGPLQDHPLPASVLPGLHGNDSLSLRSNLRKKRKFGTILKVSHSKAWLIMFIGVSYIDRLKKSGCRSIEKQDMGNTQTCISSNQMIESRMINVEEQRTDLR